MWIGFLLIIDQAIQKQEQIFQAKSTLCYVSKLCGSLFFNQAKNTGLNCIECNFIILKNISMIIFNILEHKNIIRRRFFQTEKALLTDPENKTIVGNLHIFNDTFMGNTWRDQNERTGLQGITLVLNLHLYISIQEEIQLIVIMSVKIDRRRQHGIVIIVNFKILRDHILPCKKFSL